MSKSQFPSYRLLSLVAIAATSVLVACGPDHDPLESVAAISATEATAPANAPREWQMRGGAEAPPLRERPSSI